MFKKHSVQMKFVKDQKSAEADAPKVDPDVYVHIAHETAKDVVKGAAALIGTYVAADTLRRIAIHVVATKVN